MAVYEKRGTAQAQPARITSTRPPPVQEAPCSPRITQMLALIRAHQAVIDAAPSGTLVLSFDAGGVSGKLTRSLSA